VAERDGTPGPEELQPEAAKDDSVERDERDASCDPTSSPRSAADSEPEIPAVQVIKPANARQSKPGKRPKARKRQNSMAASTLPSGAALQNTWKVRSGLPSAAPAEGAAEPASDPGGARSGTDASGVHNVGAETVEILPNGTKPPASIRADDDTPRPVGRSPHESGARMESPRIISALADTQHDDVRLRMQGQQRAARSGRLARTLRMELKLGSGAPEPPPAAAPEAFGGRSERPLLIGGAQRIGGSESSEFMSGRPPLHNTDPMGTPSARQHRGLLSDPRLQQQFTITAREASSAPPPPLPRRHSRPGERTMILTRRAHVATKDWMFVGLLVAALGVTASMLWSYRNQGNEAASEEPTGATTVEHAMTAEDNSATEAPAAASAVRATELRSDPVGAEVVASGAVVGNTPVRVARGDGYTEYTLRMPGYEPQLVRVSANSPATIHVTLQPKAAATAPATSNVGLREPATGPVLSPQPSAAAPADPATAAAAAAVRAAAAASAPATQAPPTEPEPAAAEAP
jgi:hypothetical protein